MVHQVRCCLRHPPRTARGAEAPSLAAELRRRAAARHLRTRRALSPAARLAAIIAGGLLVLAPFTVAEALWVERTSWSPQALDPVVAGAVLPGVLS